MNVKMISDEAFHALSNMRFNNYIFYETVNRVIQILIKER